MDAEDSSPREQPTGESPAITAEPRWRVWLCFILTLAGIQIALGPKIRLSQWGMNADSNAAVAEAVAWTKGRLDLPPTIHDRLAWDYPAVPGEPSDPRNRLHDTAFFEGGSYNVFPPLVTFLTALLRPIHVWLLELPEDFWPPWTQTLLFFWPLPIVGFTVFRRRTGDSAWAGLLTLTWLGGTAVLPNLHEAGFGLLGQINHVVSQIGLLIFAADVVGRRRIWPGLIGLLISTYTRQITFLYGLPLLWVAGRKGRSQFLGCLLGLGLIAAPLLALNAMKFGDPLQFGYRYIYAGRETDEMGSRCQEHGVFSTHFIPENLYYMHVAPPAVYPSLAEIRIVDLNQHGTSLWITTPLAVLVLITAHRWWREKSCRVLMLGTLPVIFGLLCYHSPGYMERGYNRFALDFLPIWLLVIAPQTRGRWRTWLTLTCTAWSMLYFQAIVPDRAMPLKPAGRQVACVVSDGQV